MTPDPLVLLPAMMTDARLFAPILPALARERAVQVAPLMGQRIEEMASAILDSAPQRFALLGAELGGMVAMEVMRRAPERVRRVALLSTTPLPENPDHAAAREPLIVRARAGRLDEVMDMLHPAGSFAPGPARLPVVAQLREMANDLGPAVFADQTRALQRRRDQQRVLREWRGAGLVMCGAHDDIYPPRRHQFIAGLMRNAHLELIDDAGHAPLLEQPEAVLAALRSWLAAPVA
ncbi:MAG: alpha/beta hydrolase [Rhodobacterales bacterium]|nr:MAG: alpha/beta hydrolase [Rhodobacterales bacterium]